MNGRVRRSQGDFDNQVGGRVVRWDKNLQKHRKKRKHKVLCQLAHDVLAEARSTRTLRTNNRIANARRRFGLQA